MNSKHAVSTHLTWGHGAPPMPHRDYGRSNHSIPPEGNGICDICSARRGHRYSNSSCNLQYLEEMRVSLYEVGHLWDTHCRPWLSNKKGIGPPYVMPCATTWTDFKMTVLSGSNRNWGEFLTSADLESRSGVRAKQGARGHLC